MAAVVLADRRLGVAKTSASLGMILAGAGKFRAQDIKFPEKRRVGLMQRGVGLLHVGMSVL